MIVLHVCFRCLFVIVPGHLFFFWKKFFVQLVLRNSLVLLVTTTIHYAHSLALPPSCVLAQFWELNCGVFPRCATIAVLDMTTISLIASR